jgi:hypothetical protein
MSKRMSHQEICEEWEAVSRAQNVNELWSFLVYEEVERMAYPVD